jgi:hypothetical protein
MVACQYILSTWEVEAGKWLLLGHFDLNGETLIYKNMKGKGGSGEERRKERIVPDI